MISAIIVNHNGGDHLRRCIKSLEQAKDCNEIIVVDSASSDGSPGWLPREYPACKLERLDLNVGFGTASNLGVRMARGDYLLLLNCDAWLGPGSLEILRAALDERPRAALAAPRLMYPDGSFQFNWGPETSVLGEAIQKVRNRFERASWSHRLVPAVLRFLLGPGFHSAACILVRRRAFEEIGGFDEKIFMYFEDVDLARRLRAAGWSGVDCTEARAWHVKGGSSGGRRNLKEYRRSQLYYYRKHRPAWEVRLLQRKLDRSETEPKLAELRNLRWGGHAFGSLLEANGILEAPPDVARRLRALISSLKDEAAPPPEPPTPTESSARRIGIDIGNALPPRDGIGNYSYHLLCALMELDPTQDFRLFGMCRPMDPGELKHALPESLQNYRLENEIQPGENGLDLLHSTTYTWPATYSGRVLFTCHDLTFLTHPQFHTLDNIVHCLHGILNAVVRGATFLAVSHFTATHLEQLLGVDSQRIHVIYPGVGPHFRPARGEGVEKRLFDRFGIEGGFLLSVGTLEPRKNHLRLIEAYNGLPDEIRESYPLLIAGPEGWKTEKKKTDLAKHGSQVRILGFVDDADLVDLYSRASAFIYPSIAEGFGLPVVEALSCGAPVVTSNTTSLPEVAGDAARLVDPYDAAQIRQAILELVTRPEEADHLRRKALARAAAFSWKRTAGKMLELYRHLAEA